MWSCASTNASGVGPNTVQISELRQIKRTIRRTRKTRTCGPAATASATPTAPAGGGGTTTRRINCGGPAYSSAAAGAWSAEQYAFGGATYLYASHDLANTADEPLYMRVRYGKSFRYDLPADPGAYTLRPHFAECWFTTAGQRRFNVSVNGSTALGNFDVVQAAGGGNRAVVKEIPVSLTGTVVSVIASRRPQAATP